MRIFTIGKTIFWGLLGAIFLTLTLSLLLVYYLEVASKEYFAKELVRPDQPISTTNATYLEHRWVGEKPDSKEVAKLAHLLKEAEITDVFVHSGPFEGDGSLPASLYPHAKEFVALLKHDYPALHVQAWLGQVRKDWGGPLLLNDETRNTIKKSVEEVLNVGFDGVHINIEPILNNDADFLALLDVLSPYMKEKKKILSVAADDVEPFPFGRILVKLYSSTITMWDLNFYKKVLAKVDQMVIMSYDSGLSRSHYYSMYVESLAKALPSDENHRVFIGIPTYDRPGKKFHPEVENMHTSLGGMIAASKSMATKPNIAIYAFWETSKSEWEEYFNFWLGKNMIDGLTIK